MNKKYVVSSYDTDGAQIAYGVFDTKKEALEKFEEVYKTKVEPYIDYMFDEVSKEEYSFTGSSGYYQFWLSVNGV